MQRAAYAYLQNSTTTKSPGEVVIMLYEGAVKFLTRAVDQMAEKDYAGKGNSISRALDIINELDSVLDREQGGEVAENLHNLYFWCSTQLALANSRMDQAIIEKVIAILNSLCSAFVEIQNNPEVRNVSSQIQAQRQQQGAETKHQARTLAQAAPVQPGQMLSGQMLSGQTLPGQMLGSSVPASGGSSFSANLRGRTLYGKMAGAV